MLHQKLRTSLYCILMLIGNLVWAQQPEKVSDSLVQNLSCASLSPENVLTWIRDDAFPISRHIPLENWGAGPLDQCWGLTLTQRKLFYLARFDSPLADPDLTETVHYALQLIRGDAPQKTTAKAQSPKQKVNQPSSGPVPFRVFHVPDLGLDVEFSNSFFQKLRLGSPKYESNFALAVERRQIRRFYQPLNIKMLLGNRDRRRSANMASMAQVEANALSKRMTMLIVRAGLMSQHVVLVKKIKRVADDHFELTVYDSNLPHLEPILTYLDGEFYSEEIAGEISEDKASPLGVFVTDEGEMDQIEATLYQYYRKVCDGKTL